MLSALRLAKFKSIHSCVFLSTLLASPPPPTHGRIRSFLDRIKSKNKLNSAINTTQLKLLNLNTQIESYECQLNELQSLTISTPEFRDIGQLDIDNIQIKLDKLHDEIISVLYKSIKDSFPNECIMEIRAAAGGAEAALFAKDLLGMYQQISIRNRWEIETIHSNVTDLGGCKNVSLSLAGEGCYEALRFEAGVHRVQRVPSTSGAGKIHTSTVTVAVLSVPRHVEVDLDTKDVRIEATRATGAGGQYVNTTDSAVRVTHIPTGLIVRCEMRRSQIENRKTALAMLRAKLFEMKYNEVNDLRSKTRDTQVGYGDRSEKIRTYNFPDDRVTDHRIGITVKGVEVFLSGALHHNFTSKLEVISREIILNELLNTDVD